jgi:nitrogen fixation/metabolism regulation signal transduction histidine kinase
LPLESEEQSDFSRGLSIIEARAASLNRFLQAYRKLAQMPRPSADIVSLGPVILRAAGLESRVRVDVQPGPELQLSLDPDQVEQMLINLIKNAAEAALEAHVSDPAKAQVVIDWSVRDAQLAIDVRDNGRGLSNPDNTFVPFYTTKPEGTGIGLVLSRQIAEAHAGSITLANRKDADGCIARVLLPVRREGTSASGHSLAKTNIPA